MITEVSQIKHEFLIRDLLNTLTNHDLSKESELNQIYEKIVTIYQGSQRLSYYCISDYIIEEYNKDKFTPDIITDQIMYFIEKMYEIKIEDDDFHNVIKLSLKISDHIKLEKLRQENYRANEETTFAQFFNSANSRLESKYENLNSKVDRIDVSAITILGVFTAITISVFGTLDVVGNLLATIHILSIPRALFSLSLSGLIIFDTIFLLLHTLSKFTNTTLEKTTYNSKIVEALRKFKQTDSGEFITEKRFLLDSKIVQDLINFRRRYPLVFYYNALMLGLTCLSVLIWYLDKYHLHFL